ncbi:PHB depolymerase family esterase [Gordonia sp. ABSL1-1]|uniref:alpha/beta hydrolase family esterase n=1 Tax=Gordonia sp. ABSL1-1 TaxID=3053923 RepID=UPI002572EF75|nr:PHB depolymerase family esterase [Gordonia sp. ABSL1-1]MDL9937318.1 PHB depolymerase family esterase [Gordonia sp. ABSL1-1]
MQKTGAALWCAVIAVASILVGSASWAASAPARATTNSPIYQAGNCTRLDGLHPGSAVRTLRVAGVERSYRIHVPVGIGPRPLVLAFHGHGERNVSFERYTGLSKLPAIVVYPEALRGVGGTPAWQGAPYSSPRSDDIGFTRAILTDVRARLCVDPGRTFVLGRSNGGGLTMLLACRMPGQFAAFAVVNGAVYTRTIAGCRPRPASVIDFHGTADGTIHYNGGRRFGERYLAVSQWLGMWTRAAGCVSTPLTVATGPSVDRMSWPLCSALGHEVVHYRINGGTHRWPALIDTSPFGSVSTGSSELTSSTAVIWRFFSAHAQWGGSGS